MKGFYVERRFGWDTHGLPIEHEIDKKLGISGKAAVTELGIGKYNEECRAIVMRYASEWRTTVERLGRWIDFDNDYKVCQARIDPLLMCFAYELYRPWTRRSWKHFGGYLSSSLKKDQSIRVIVSCPIRLS